MQGPEENLAPRHDEETAFCRRGTIAEIDVDADGTMQILLAIDHQNQQHLKRALGPTSPSVFFQPDPSHTGLEFRQHRLRYHSISAALQTHTTPRRRTILQSLLGLPHHFPLCRPSDADFHGHLTAEEAIVIETLKCGSPVLFQQAPAGTGKTYVIAAYDPELLTSWTNQDTNVLVPSATTNNAVINIATTVLQMIPGLSLTQMICKALLQKNCVILSGTQLMATGRSTAFQKSSTP